LESFCPREACSWFKENKYDLMNEEEEEAPLEDLRFRWNRLAQERHAPGLKKINTI
jgi:hypothetical protein